MKKQASFGSIAGSSVLAEEAIKSALKDYYDKNGIAYDAAQFPNGEDCAHCAE